MKKLITIFVLVCVIFVTGLFVFNAKGSITKMHEDVHGTSLRVEQAINENVLTYTSKSLGISFEYRNDQYPIDITEEGNKIIVAGQTKIQMFEKDPSKTFTESIQETLLKEYDPKKCFVVLDVPTELYKYETAHVSYPPTGDLGSAECSYEYQRAGSNRGFMYDPTHPDRFFFIDSGQAVAAFAPTKYGTEGGRSKYGFEYTIKIIDQK